MLGALLGNFCTAAFMNYWVLECLSANLVMPRKQGRPPFFDATPWVVHHTNRRDGCCHRTQALELENRSRAPPKISSLGSTRRSPAQTTHQPPLALGQPQKPNCQKIVTVGTCRPYLPNVRCVGKQRIFHKKQDSLGIMQAQHLDQTLGCIPLTIVLHRTILQRRLARRQAQIPTLCRDGQSPLIR